MTAKAEDDKPIYLVEVQQAGIFLVKGLDDEQLKQMLGAYCPNLLFPYAREAADSVVRQELTSESLILLVDMTDITLKYLDAAYLQF